MDVCQESPLLTAPLGPPEQTSKWSHKKLTDPRARPVLERTVSLGEARLMGEIIIKEFLELRIVPLQAHSLPLWDFTNGGDPMFLHVSGLTYNKLDLPWAMPSLYACEIVPLQVHSCPLGALLGPIPEDLPQAMLSLYACDDMDGMVGIFPPSMNGARRTAQGPPHRSIVLGL
ncbi:hypothetical protein D1007_58234 [Hordeum vulgare]|nr:hypothetical protein D1007_58234 [Hordeum vulgare]